MEKASSLYESILNDYTLLDQTCLLCAKNEQTQILNEDFSCNDLKIDIIDDINGEKYNNLIQYITPTKCTHFYHNNCLNKYNNTHKKYKILQTPENCVFCNLYITINNMQKFGNFFSKKVFQNIIENPSHYTDSTSSRFDEAKKEIIEGIEKSFYSEIEKSFRIDDTKKEKLLQLRKINRKYKKNYPLLRQYHSLSYSEKNHFYKYYEFSINKDMDKEENDLNDLIQKQRERVREIEREDQEEYEGKRPVFLKICDRCRDICIFCKGKKFVVGYRLVYDYKAHKGCLINDEDSCCICGRNDAKFKTGKSICHDCYKSLGSIDTKCYYCRKYLY